MSIELLNKLKSQAGEISITDFTHLMLRDADGSYFYFDPARNSYIGYEAGREVIQHRTPGDIVSVEWKGAGETFETFIKRKTVKPIETKPEPTGSLASVIGQERAEQVAQMDHVISDNNIKKDTKS